MSERSTRIDALRVIASLGVVFIHAASYADALPFALINALTRFSVPLFFMISGYCMLDRNYSLSDIFRKTVRLLLLMLGWSAVYCAVSHPDNFIKELFAGPVHFWYFYAAAGLYLLSPVLSVFTKNTDKKTFRYALTLLFIFGCILYFLPETYYIYEILSKTKLPLSTGFIFCYLFGGYVKKYPLTKCENTLLRIAGIIGVTATFTVIYFIPSLKEIAISFFSPAVIASASAVFTLPLPRKISRLAPYTFGIYIVHVLVLTHVTQPLLSSAAKGFVYVISCTAITFILSLAITCAIKKIPILRKTV